MIDNCSGYANVDPDPKEPRDGEDAEEQKQDA